MSNEIKIERSCAGLRELLFQEMENFLTGKSSIKRAQTVINFSREIMTATKLEIVQSALTLSKKDEAQGERRTLTL